MEFFHRPEDPNNQIGFWGQRTSAVDWCESNYTWSFYVAEFWNTITSLPAAFLAFYGLYLTYKYGYDRRFIVVNLMVCLVGIGSAAFHGTLLYTGQILDELPMVYASISFLYAIMEMESDSKPVYKYLAPTLVAFSLIFTGVYLYLPDFFIFFLIAYICAILTLVYRCSIIFRKPTTLTHQKVFIVASVGFYIGGWLFFWIPEILFCDQLQVFNFHAWWHVTSTLGAFVLVLFSVFQRELHRGRNPQLNYNKFMGVPLLPYVHIPAQKEKQESPSEQPKPDKEKKRKVDTSNELSSVPVFRR
jgi:dihydroceramidase